ncbi:MAG: WD40 repeat domain-containing protein [Candidatus Thorarchaeota archaeon]
MITVWKKSNLRTFEQFQSKSSTYLKSLLVDDHYLYGGTLWNDCSIKLYDKSSLELLNSFEGSQGTVFALVSDHSNLFCGSGDSRVTIWNKDDWSELGSFRGQKHFVLSLSIDENYIYAGGIDDCTNVFSRDDHSQVVSLRGHESNVLSLACDKRFLYSGSGELWWGGPGSPRPPQFESAIRVWDKKDWSCVAILEGHTDNVNAVSVASNYVFSISDDSTLRIYSKKDWSETLCVHVDTRRIDAMTSDDRSVFIGCADGTIRQLSKHAIIS